MAFCSFSKEFTTHSFTYVENRFIQKYLPEANDFAVKVYLYGLHLCQCGNDDFSARSLAEVLKTSEEKILDAFDYWQDYDLVEILCRNPLTVQYLPVANQSGRPKKIHYDKYADFTQELQKKMQKVGRFLSLQEIRKYLQFLEETDLQPMAFLLIIEYSLIKDGGRYIPYHVFEKAKQLVQKNLTTYDQIAKLLGDYDGNEKEINELFEVLHITRLLHKDDYALYNSWLQKGFEKGAIYSAAKYLKKGSMASLQILLDELAEKKIFTAIEVNSYLTKREKLSSLTFRIARKLGVKVANPATYIDEYVEKWISAGYTENSLLDIALYCMKTDRKDFARMNDYIEQLISANIVAAVDVKQDLKRKNENLKLLSKIQEICGSIHPSSSNISLLSTWTEWGFSSEMILEAAKWATGKTSPMTYANRILSNWKKAGYKTIDDIPKDEKPTAQKTGTGGMPSYAVAAVEAANAKSAREKYYADKREKAQSVADRYVSKAKSSPRFGAIEKALSKMNMELAKAEIFQPDTLPTLKAKQTELVAERLQILSAMGIEEWQLLPQYECKKCLDSGFMADGKACDCYKV